VGITRAKDRLYLLRAMQRGGRMMSEETYPSRFLDDVPADLLAEKSRRGRSSGSSRSRSSSSSSASSSWQMPTPRNAAPILEPKFRAGTRIKHPLWGEGIVLDSKIQDNDEIVDVVFESVGIKRLAASLANLQII
jgi:DNA helicase-2/ATP-dependent DNA helicase PcrA